WATPRSGCFRWRPLRRGKGRQERLGWSGARRAARNCDRTARLLLEGVASQRRPPSFGSQCSRQEQGQGRGGQEGSRGE
ncbi:unnamed protein product, partial [Polarella glacialis]